MFRLLTLLFFLHLSSNAQSFQSRSDTTKSLKVEVVPYIGLSKQNFSYNIAGTEAGTDPNILSELKWDRTVTREIGGNLNVSYKRIIFKSTFLYSKTISGDVSDIDYAEDNRQSIFSEHYFSNHEGGGHLVNLMLGYNLIRRNRYLLDLFMAYEHVSNKLFLLNEKHIAEDDPDYQPNLNSYYKYQYPNLGGVINSSYSLNRLINLSLEISLYRTFYYAYGNWNLRGDFAQPRSYEHKGNGTKFSSSIGAHVVLTNRLSVAVCYSFTKQDLKDGKDVLFTSTGDVLKTRLNEVKQSKSTIFFTLNHSIF